MVIAQYDVLLVALDQIRTVDRRRLVKKLGRVEAKTISSIKTTIQEMLVD